LAATRAKPRQYLIYIRRQPELPALHPASTASAAHRV